MTKRFFFVILIILASFFYSFAQTASLKSDLEISFKNVNTARLNVSSAIRQAKAGKSISIAASNKTFNISVAPRDLRSANFTAEDSSVVGLRSLTKAPVTTYRGVISGENDSEVRLTMDASGVEGYLQTGNERFFIEPAKKYSRLATADDYIVYQAEDVLRDKNIICPQDLAEKMEAGKSMVATEGIQAPNALKVVEIATEADYDFVTSTGGTADSANAKILSILNMVEGVYERELNLSLRVVYQHAWTTADPFDGTNTTTLLNSFQAHWNANFPASRIPRDTAHLFTYKPNIRAQGFAFIGVICKNSSAAYGLSGRVDTSWGWEEANFLITTHEIGHNLGATHSDAYTNCANTVMNAGLNGSTQLSFCAASQMEINNFVSANSSCLNQQTFGWLDFDGDGKTDIAVFRALQGEWWINRSSTGETVVAQFGISSDKATPGDFTGDGKTDVALWRQSTGEWFILRSEDNSFLAFPFGTNGDTPVVGDFDGDGKADQGIYRPSTNVWYIQKSTGGVAITTFGTLGDAPVVADYDGDKKADIAIFRPSNNSWWYIRSSDNTYRVFQFARGTDKPVIGDWTGDGKADLAVYRPTTGEWFVMRSEDGSYYAVPFGSVGDVPAPGDYDGDGKFDTAIFRPSERTWYINRSTTGVLITGFGLSTDKPVPNVYIP